ncbi:Yip1 domain-containing protein [Marininema mesophilum]|uniref:Yip1 domain-containing protein n=1 Tax=Marininema mesophilum TaxID=1048340 RepID=A0A1H2X6C7_9BACL|nr:Yip1 domain-containing protein [Marininema mesophilum]
MNNPLLTIWRNPSGTFQEILDSRRWSSALWLAPFIYLTGVYDLLSNAMRNGSGESVEIYKILILSLLVSLLWGPISWIVESLLYWGVGRLFGGDGEWRESMLAAVWTKVPLIICMIVIWIPLFIILGPDLFRNNSDFTAIQVILGLIFSLFWFIIFIFYLYISSHVITEAHGFESNWRGFFVFLVSKIGYLIPMFIVYLILQAILL